MSTSKPTDEWYTPPEIIEAVCKLFPDGYFDPYGELGTPATDGAEEHFVYPEKDALVDAWPDLPAYVNFPYSKVLPHVEALLRNDSPAYIVVCNASTAAEWFQTLLGRSLAVVFPSPRIRFLRWPKSRDEVIDGVSAKGKSPTGWRDACVAAWEDEQRIERVGDLVRPGSPRYNNAIFYDGDDPDGFIEIFGRFGAGGWL